MEISTNIKIGVATSDSSLSFDIVQNLKRIGYRNLLIADDYKSCFALQLNHQVELIIVDLVNNEKPIYPELGQLCTPIALNPIPVLVLTGPHQITKTDIVFLNHLGIDHILATPFTQKSIARNVIQAWSNFHHKKKRGMLIKLYLAAQAYIEKDAFDAARKIIEQQQKLFPVGNIHHEQTGYLLLKEKNRPAGIKLLADLAQQTDQLYQKFRCAQVLFKNREFSQAKAILQGIEDHTIYAISELLGFCHFCLEEFNEAIPHLAKYLKIFPKNENVLNHTAICYKEIKQYDAALKLYSVLHKITLQPWKIKFNIALLELKKNDKEKAMAVLKDLLKEKPDYEKARLKLVELTEKTT